MNSLEANIRDNSTKGKLNAIRNSGNVPCVVYGGKDENQKISISANEGNFLNKNEILLKNDVVFKSKKFTIFSDDVIFNKNQQTASSTKKSRFISSNTSILANSTLEKLSEDFSGFLLIA